MKRHNNSDTGKSVYSGIEVISSRAPMSTLSPKEEAEKYMFIQKEFNPYEMLDLELCEVGIRRFLGGVKIGAQGEVIIINDMIEKDMKRELEKAKASHAKKQIHTKQVKRQIRQDIGAEEWF